MSQIGLHSRPAAIVTGGTRGLGYHIVDQLLGAGYNAMIVSTGRDQHNVAMAFDQKYGVGRIFTTAVNIGIEAQARYAVTRTVRELGYPVVLVNNAGTVHDLTPLVRLDPRTFLRCLRINLLGTYYMMRAALPFMDTTYYTTEHKGTNLLVVGGGGPPRRTIVNIASTSAIVAVPMLAGYNASKAGVISITQTAAKEVSDRVNIISVSPGGMNTEMRKEVYGEKDATAQQDPAFVASVITEIVTKGTAHNLDVPNGANVIIRSGLVRVIAMQSVFD